MNFFSYESSLNGWDPSAKQQIGHPDPVLFCRIPYHLVQIHEQSKKFKSLRRGICFISKAFMLSARWGGRKFLFAALRIDLED